MPLTKYHSGGTVTERHILLSLSNKFIKNFVEESYFNTRDWMIFQTI